MIKNTIYITWLIVIILLNSCKKDKFTEFDFIPLEFHFANPDDIDYIAGFGIPDWSAPGSPHNGIDLRIKSYLEKSVIISPSNGTIKKISRDNIGIGVEININKDYSVMVGFEPGDTSVYLQSQMNALKVKPGQIVHSGDTLGDLLIGRLGYPHIHLLLNINRRNYCPYNYSSVDAQNIYNQIAEERESNLPCGAICCEESVAQ